jgi:hypothetical protein
MLGILNPSYEDELLTLQTSIFKLIVSSFSEHARGHITKDMEVNDFKERGL